MSRQRTREEWEALREYILMNYRDLQDMALHFPDDKRLKMSRDQWRHRLVECERRMTTTTIEGDAS